MTREERHHDSIGALEDDEQERSLGAGRCELLLDFLLVASLGQRESLSWRSHEWCGSAAGVGGLQGCWGDSSFRWLLARGFLVFLWRGSGLLFWLRAVWVCFLLLLVGCALPSSSLLLLSLLLAAVGQGGLTSCFDLLLTLTDFFFSAPLLSSPCLLRWLLAEGGAGVAAAPLSCCWLACGCSGGKSWRWLLFSSLLL